VIGEYGVSGAAGKRLAASMAILLLAATAGCSKRADEAKGNFSSDPETAKIEKIVHDYVIGHPEIIEEAFDQRDSHNMAKLVDEHRKDLETPFGSAWAGARDGDVTLVEFFDYNCGFCRKSNPDIARLLAEDRNLKVVWRELPVLGESSDTAARASLAAAKQGKFKEFHDRLYAAGSLTPENISKVQLALGVVPMQSPDFEQEIDKNKELARKLDASGTPTFVVGDKIISGAVGYDKLKEAIEEARKKA
jgi:thiol-disulfide isomerase/thioredoxin